MPHGLRLRAHAPSARSQVPLTDACGVRTRWGPPQSDAATSAPAFVLPAPFGDLNTGNTTLNATWGNGTWGNSSASGNATRFVVLDGAEFFDSSLVNGGGVSAPLLRAAMAAEAARASADLRLVDVWITAQLRFGGLTRASATTVDFEDALASGATAAVLASATGVSTDRLSVDGFAFGDDAWSITITLRGFGGHLAAVNAAAQTLRQPATAVGLGAALQSFLCSADESTCVDVEVTLAALTVRAVAAATPRPAPPPPPPGQAPMTDDPSLTAKLGLVIGGIGALLHACCFVLAMWLFVFHRVLTRFCSLSSPLAPFAP